MAREVKPRKKKPVVMTDILGVRLHAADYERLVARAKAAKQTASVWARQAILEALAALERVTVTEVYGLKDPNCPVVVVPNQEVSGRGLFNPAKNVHEQFFGPGGTSERMHKAIEAAGGNLGANAGCIFDPPQEESNMPRNSFSTIGNIPEGADLTGPVNDWHCSYCKTPSHEPAEGELVVCPTCGTQGCVTTQMEKENEARYQEAALAVAKREKPSWSTEWPKLQAMDPAERAARMTELRAGRPIDSGFKDWPVEKKIEWLDREWPLAGGPDAS